MDPLSRSHAAAIDQLQRGLADVVVDSLFESDPGFAERYGPGGSRIWRTEVTQRLAHLAEAVACGRPGLFVQHAAWAAEALRARSVPDADIDAHLAQLAATASVEFPADVAAAAMPCIDAGRAASRTPAPSCGLLDTEGSDSTLARLYLLHLLQRDKDEAATLVLEALRGGMPLADVHERVVAPALAEIGRMWHMQEASIADEHFCTAATRMIVGQLRAAAQPMARKPDGRRALCFAVGGDMHDIGLRMVADLLELDGWTVEYLGANVPAGEIVMSIEDFADDPRRSIDLAVASAATTLSIRPLMDLVAALRSSEVARLTPILVGGGPFAADLGLAAVVGADAGARSLRDAVAAAERLVPASASRQPR